MHVDLVRHARAVPYRWYLLASAVLSMGVGSGVLSWPFGLYIGPVEAEFGWTRGEVAAGYSMMAGGSALTAPLVGRWIDRRGAREVLIAGGAAAALSHALLATTGELWQWYAYWAISGAARQLVLFLPFHWLIARAFVERRALALSLLGSGASAGGMAAVPALQMLIDSAGWRTSVILSSATICIVLVPVGYFIVRNVPAEVEVSRDGDSDWRQPGAGMVLAAGHSLGAALRSKHFWVAAAAFAVLFFGFTGVRVHQVPLFVSLGLSRESAALITGATAGLGIGTRIACGYIGDRVARFDLALAVMCLAMAGGCVALLADGGLSGIVVFTILWLFGSAATALGESVLLVRMFGAEHFATLFGTITVIEYAGIMVSPALAGKLFDASGSYGSALLLFACTFTLAAGLFGLLARLTARAHRLPSGSGRA